MPDQRIDQIVLTVASRTSAPGLLHVERALRAEGALDEKVPGRRVDLTPAACSFRCLQERAGFLCYELKKGSHAADGADPRHEASDLSRQRASAVHRIEEAAQHQPPPDLFGSADEDDLHRGPEG